MKEDNRVSEQTFGVGINVGNPQSLPAATLETFDSSHNFDYSLSSPGQSFVILTFHPNQQNVTLPFFLFADTLPEGTEAFRASSTSALEFPTFQPPVATAFASTEIQIIDNDCKIILC